MKLSLAPPQTEPDIGFYTLAQVLRIFPVSRATLYREIKANRFPGPTQLTRGRVGWDKNAIHEHHAKVLEASRGMSMQDALPDRRVTSERDGINRLTLELATGSAGK